MMRSWILAMFLVVSFATSAGAGEGEGHSHDEPAPRAGGTRSPRLEGKSDQFELVGILENGALRLFLDRYATNEPVTDATIEVEADSLRATAKPQPDGTYLVEAEALRRPGSVAFTFTVTAGTDVDLLSGNLTIPEPAHPHGEAGNTGRHWRRAALGVVLAASVLLVAVGAARMWRRNGGARP